MMRVTCRKLSNSFRNHIFPRASRLSLCVCVFCFESSTLRRRVAVDFDFRRIFLSRRDFEKQHACLRKSCRMYSPKLLTDEQTNKQTRREKEREHARVDFRATRLDPRNFCQATTSRREFGRNGKTMAAVVLRAGMDLNKREARARVSSPSFLKGFWPYTPISAIPFLPIFFRE